MSTLPTTDATTEIAAALARLRAACRRPGFGHRVTTSVSTLGDRLRCTTVDGPHAFETDLPRALGGDGAAPSPTVLLRTALGACLAISYRMHAATLGVELTAVTVTVDTESALVGMLDPAGGARPGFTRVRYHVDVTSPAPAADVERALDLADRLGPVLDLLTRPTAVDRTVTITAPED